MQHTKKTKRTSKFIVENQALYEEISRAVLTELDYAEVVDENLMSTRLRPLLLEELDTEKLKELEANADQAKADIEEFIGELGELGMSSTIEYLNTLKGKLPGTFGLVKMALFGDAEDAAKKIGEVTSVASKLQLAKDSVASAIELVGNELGGLPFADKKNWDTFIKEKADEDGNIDGPDGEKISVQEIADAIETESVGDILEKAAEMQEPLADFQFPTSEDVFNAAKSEYKPPSEDQPTGLWGKLMGAFGGKDLSGDDFATDIMAAPLGLLITQAKEMAALAAEAEKEQTETEAGMEEIEDDLAALGKGDDSAVDKSGAPSSEVEIPGVGRVPLTADTLRRIFPGIDGMPDEVAGRKAEKIPDLSRTVVEPEGLPSEFADQLAQLINDDNKAPVTFANPEEAEKAAEEGDSEPQNAGYVPDGRLIAEYFKARERLQDPWVHKRNLPSALLTEDIFYKDVEKLLKTVVGTTPDLEDEADIPKVAKALAKRLSNQYDVTIADIPGDDGDKESPGGDAPEGVADAFGNADRDVVNQALDLLKQQNDNMMKMFKAFAKSQGVSAKNAAEQIKMLGQGDIDGAAEIAKESDKEPSDIIAAIDGFIGDLPDHVEDSSDGAAEEPVEDSYYEYTTGKGKKTAVIVRDTLSDNDDEVQVSTPDGKGGWKNSTFATSKAKLGDKFASEKKALKDTVKQEAYYRRGMLTEVLLGPRVSGKADSEEELSRWLELAGLENE